MKNAHNRGRSPAQQASWSTIWAYLGVALGALNFIILFPRLLGIEEVGLIRLIAAGSLIFIHLGFFGLNSSAVRFLSGLRPSGDSYKTHWRLLMVLCLAGMLTVGLAFLPIVWHYLDSPVGIMLPPAWGLLLFYALCISMMWQRFGEMIAQVAGSTAQASFWHNTAPRLALLGGAIGILAELWGFAGLIFLWVLSHVFGTVLLNATTLRRGLHSNPLGRLPNRKKAMDVFRFSAYGFAGNAAAVLQTTIDSIMLSALSTLGQLGLYTPYAYAAALIDVPTRALTAACYPVFRRYIKDGEYAKVSALFRDLCFIQLSIGGCLLLGLWINLPVLTSLLGASEYQNGGPILIILGSSFWLSSAVAQASSIFLSSEHYRLQSIVNWCALLTGITLNFLFIPHFAAIGAAAATAITISLSASARVFLLWNKLGINPFSKRAAGIASIIAAFAAVTWLTPEIESHRILFSMAESATIFGIIILICSKAGLVKEFAACVRRLKTISDSN